VTKLADRRADIRPDSGFLQVVRISPFVRIVQAFHCGPDRIHYVPQVRRPATGRLLELIQRRKHCSATRMSEHDHQAGSEFVGRKLDAADLGRHHDISRNPDHEQVTQALVEHQFSRHPRIGAAQQDGEGVLVFHQLLPP
jgi:hypothetical protein